MGVNQTIFNETTFNKLGANSDLFHFETNRSQQMIALHNASQANETTFHFLKNGELISIDRVRDRIVYPVPRVVRIFMHPYIARFLRMIEDGIFTADIIKDDDGNIIGFENIVRVAPVVIPE
jgi:hypothetical protein